jgi:hypothetical protein
VAGPARSDATVLFDVTDRGRALYRHACDKLNALRSMSLARSVTHCATDSPIAAECLKPCPEQGDTMNTASCAGWRSITKRLPRVLV